MIVLGLLLLAVAVAVIVIVVIEGGAVVELEVFGRSVETQAWGVFVAGVATGFVVLGGIAVLAMGIRRAQARRREIEYLRERVAEREHTASDLGDDEPAPGNSWGTGEGQNSGLGRRRPVDTS